VDAGFPKKGTRQRKHRSAVIEPADIARLALFLASDDSRMITKQTIAVNGGTI
jgi:NAD(P)-dependent dehydrogenase (short-subunit alcohol dehydrogenase family)